MEYLEDTETEICIGGSDTKSLDSQVLRQADKVREKYYNLGYREGFFEAKATFLQKSFDSGYYHGAIKAIQEVLKIENLEGINAEHCTVEELNRIHVILKESILSMHDCLSIVSEQ